MPQRRATPPQQHIGQRHQVMPWWWAMKVLHRRERLAAGRRAGVKSSASMKP
jgi:hypothetical protein